MLAFTVVPTFVTIVTLSSVIGEALAGSLVSPMDQTRLGLNDSKLLGRGEIDPSLVEVKKLPPYDSRFLGDMAPPGVFHTPLDDRALATSGGIKRRLVKIQVWCDDERGPSSMIPWYNDHNGEAGNARHWTWGMNPPRGTYMSLDLDHDTEYINNIGYAECGPLNHKRICYLFIGKTNKLTQDGDGISCASQNNLGKAS